MVGFRSGTPRQGKVGVVCSKRWPAGSHVGRVKSTGRPRMEESCWSMVSPLRNRKSQSRKTSSTGGGGAWLGCGEFSQTFSSGEGGHKARAAIIIPLFASTCVFVQMLDAPPFSRVHIPILGHAGLISGSLTSSFIKAIVFS